MTTCLEWSRAFFLSGLAKQTFYASVLRGLVEAEADRGHAVVDYVVAKVEHLIQSDVFQYGGESRAIVA